jgi:CheY-like chemotaxis protein
MITASAQPETLTEARALGANGYILKPFSITTLRRTLTKVLGRF